MASINIFMGQHFAVGKPNLLGNFHIFRYGRHLLDANPSADYAIRWHNAIRDQAAFAYFRSLKDRAVFQSAPRSDFTISPDDNVWSDFAFRADLGRRINQAPSLAAFDFQAIVF